MVKASMLPGKRTVINLTAPLQNFLSVKTGNQRNLKSMAEAVREAVDENDGKRDLAVAVDGSWQKRGFLRRMAW
ncbi:hypothetical protein TNCV_3302621 [Trichonephila clavipes]|nr:hypothetical protein TNCV_3302621 [Trichonephila clavipes]